MARKKNTRVQYAKLVPPDSFLGAYLQYLSPLETPHAYDFWTGLYVLSCAIGRNLFVNRPGALVFLNIYAILVAESGTTRKSTSVRIATDFIRDLASDHSMLVEKKITPEKLEYHLWRQSEEYGRCGALISISELATFLGREKYVETLPALLTDLYDCPNYRLGGGTLSDRSSLRGIPANRFFQNVFVSFLSASTPSWLLRAVNPDVIEGGFTSRVCFIVAEQAKKQVSWPEPLDDAIANSIRQSISRVRDYSASVERIEISEGARKTFDRWYRSRNLYRDPFRSSFHAREDDHILRVAALLCINDDTWVIQHNHILSAIKIITQVREDGASIFEGTGANSRLVIGIDKIRDKLLAAGQNGLPQRELTRAVALYMNGEQMTTALDIMHELHMVQKFEVPPLGRGRPATIWRGTNQLIASNAIDTIVESYAPTRS